MVMNVVPKEEWKQIFNDVWRFERDYLYDPNMHGVDWAVQMYGKEILNPNHQLFPKKKENF